MGHKRIKIEDADAKNFEYKDGDTTIYDQESLYKHISNEGKITITMNYDTNKRSATSKVNNKNTYFKDSIKELQNS